MCSASGRDALQLANGFDQVALPAAGLTPWIVDFARDRGLGIRAWQVRREEDLDRVIVAGADGVTVNWPERASAYFSARRVRRG